jgi:S-phase kinase-associated protein 1
MSNMVSSLIEEDDSETVIDVPISNVNSTNLAKVIEYCSHFQAEPMTPITTPLKSSKLEDLVQPWYVDFVKVDQTMLFELVTAANYMDIKPLLDLTCLAVSIYIKGRSAEELRRIFNLSDEFTPEEEAQVREENSWNEQAQP